MPLGTISTDHFHRGSHLQNWTLLPTTYIKPWKTFDHNPPISRHLASRGADPSGIGRRHSKEGRDWHRALNSRT
ncbi:hypothetical protein ACN38_g8196 [Penicillium nordicum]|uniref:Uncharacterized protein n=1 Tax=Penicillium nordicum TaxID=229535 RepID=A0A0M8P430_9EURO|nr:hypothetical protein ACN38_g8196 [Penicillium nordicum]